jgi:hypothetical protein
MVDARPTNTTTIISSIMVNPAGCLKASGLFISKSSIDGFLRYGA